MKDTITINKLKVQANIGILPWERESAQEIHITVQYAIDAAKAAVSDDIKATVSYADVRDKVIAVVASQHFDLIETMAERLAQELLNKFALYSVAIEVCKPTIFADADGVSICIERKA